jgi:cysteine desulfurase / selenocysteine lyase
VELESIRAREFPGLGRRIHMDAASWGPHPARTGRALDVVNRRREEGGTLQADYFTRILSEARAQVALLLGAPAREVALAPNTTWGVQLAATLVGAGPPGRILYCHGEFPACVLPWRSLLGQGFILEEVPSDPQGRPNAARLLDRIREASDLRAVTLSVVQFATGVPVELAPVVEACRAREVFLALDAIQALGVHPLPAAALEADLIASGAQKWLLSPWGSGFARIHPRHLDGPTPLPPVVSWLGFESAMDFATLLDYDPTPLPDARRFEPATLGIQDFAGMAASLGLLNEVGIDRIAAHVARVQAPLVDWLRRRGGEDPKGPVVPVTSLEDGKRAGIVAFRSAARDEVARRAEEEGITLSVREGLVRVSPHLYSTVEEMERVVEVLDAVH